MRETTLSHKKLCPDMSAVVGISAKNKINSQLQQAQEPVRVGKRLGIIPCFRTSTLPDLGKTSLQGLLILSFNLILRNFP